MTIDHTPLIDRLSELRKTPCTALDVATAIYEYVSGLTKAEWTSGQWPETEGYLDDVDALEPHCHTLLTTDDVAAETHRLIDMVRENDHDILRAFTRAVLDYRAELAKAA